MIGRVRFFEGLLKMDPFTLLLIILFPIYVIVLSVLFKHLINISKGRLIRIALCFVPVVAALFHVYFCGFRSEPLWTLHYYKYLYLAAFAALLLLLFPEHRIIHRISSFIAALSAVAGSVACLVSITLIDDYQRISNFTRLDYVTSFNKTVEQMEEYYPLSDWKEIDYASIKREILPKVEAAQTNNDPAAFYAAINEYVHCFHDGHFSLGAMSMNGAEHLAEFKNLIYGNDYGFSMITLSSGETVAIMIDHNSVAYSKGISEGTIIIGWDGKNIDDAISSVENNIYNYYSPVSENDDILKPVLLAGQGGDELSVSFIDADNTEKTITLKSSGSYADRLTRTVNRFFHNDIKWYCFGDIETEDITNEMNDDIKEASRNFRTSMISSNCGYIAINKLNYTFSNTIDNVNALLFCNYSELIDKIDTQLDHLKKNGMDRLVIDLRNNGGGNSVIAAKLVELFSDKPLHATNYGTYINKQRRPSVDLYTEPYGKWKDLKIVVLTNAKCISGGDLLCSLLSQCPNVTLMGITCSNNSCQSPGGLIVFPDSECYLQYPIFTNLDKNNEPLIDTDSSRKNRIPLDVIIPITADSIEQIFYDHTADYELDYAVDYLSRNN